MTMLTPTPAPDWESPDVSAFRQFVESDLGKKVFAVLVSQRPLLTGRTTEEAALSGKLVQGFELAVTALILMAYPVKEDASARLPSNYPPLDDDERWDGTKPI